MPASRHLWKRTVRRLGLGSLTVAITVGLPASVEAHAGPGLLVAADGTIYFTMFGPFPLMMIRPGGEPELAVPEVGPTWLHHLAWLPDGRIAVANERGEVYAVTPGVGFERYLPPEALGRLADAALPDGVEGPVTAGSGGGGDPFTIGPDGSIYTVLSSIDRPRVVRIDPDGTLAFLAGGARGVRDAVGARAGFGELHSSGMAADGEGGVYVVDESRLRHVASDGTVRTLATLDGWFTGVTVDAGVPLATVVARGGPGGVARVGVSESYEPMMFDERLDYAIGVAVGPDGALFLKDQADLASRIWRWTPEEGMELVGVAEETAWLAVLYPDADFAAVGGRSGGSPATWLYGVFGIAAGLGLLAWRRGRGSIAPTG